VLAVADAFEDSLFDKPVEPVGEDVAGNPKALLELVEAAQAQEGVTNDQERPALADDLERACNRAVLAFVVPFQHAFKLAV
jgi:squalene cyclase